MPRPKAGLLFSIDIIIHRKQQDIIDGIDGTFYWFVDKPDRKEQFLDVLTYVKGQIKARDILFGV